MSRIRITRRRFLALTASGGVILTTACATNPPGSSPADGKPGGLSPTSAPAASQPNQTPPGANAPSLAPAATQPNQAVSGAGRQLTFWHSYVQTVRMNAMRTIADKFEAQNPGVKVSIEAVPWSAFPKKWPAAKAGGTLPDVTTLVSYDAISMFYADAIYPVDAVIQDLGGSDVFKPGILDRFSKYEGKYVSLPHYAQDILLLYRKDWLKEAGLGPPETWDDALKAAIAITKPPDHFGWILKLNKADIDTSYLLWIMTRSNDGHFFDADGKVTFDSPEVKEAVQFVAELGRKASPPDAVNYRQQDAPNLLATSKTAMQADSLFSVVLATQTTPDLADKLAGTHMPKKKQVGNLVSPANLALPKGKNPDDAKKFLRFLFNDEDYVPFLLTIPGQAYPVLKKAAKSPLFWENPTVKKYATEVNTVLDGIEKGSGPGFDFGPNPYAGPVFSASLVEGMMQRILLQNVSIDDAVKETAQEMHDIIDDVKAKLKR